MGECWTDNSVLTIVVGTYLANGAHRAKRPRAPRTNTASTVSGKSIGGSSSSLLNFCLPADLLRRSRLRPSPAFCSSFCSASTAAAYLPDRKACEHSTCNTYKQAHVVKYNYCDKSRRAITNGICFSWSAMAGAGPKRIYGCRSVLHVWTEPSYICLIYPTTNKVNLKPTNIDEKVCTQIIYTVLYSFDIFEKLKVLKIFFCSSDLSTF